MPDEPRIDRVQHNADFTKDVQWRGLSRPRRAAFRAAEVPGVGIHARAFDRTRTRIEPARLDFWTGLVGAGFSLFGFLRRFRLCPLAGLRFGHVLFALADGNGVGFPAIGIGRCAWFVPVRFASARSFSGLLLVNSKSP